METSDIWLVCSNATGSSRYIPTSKKTYEALWNAGIKVSLEKITVATDPPFPTPGMIFYVDFEDLGIIDPSGEPKLLRDREMVKAMKKLTAALHGTSLDAAKKIIEQRGFQSSIVGVNNTTDGKEGVYCEGNNRRHCCLGYSTLAFADGEHIADTTLYSCFFEMFVDREVGTGVRGQFVQPPSSIFITGLYIHALPLQKLFEKGWMGQFVYSPKIYDQMKDHKFIRDRLNPKAAADDRYPNPVQQRATSQPATDSSASLSMGSSERSSSATGDSISHRDWNCRDCDFLHTGTDSTSWWCVKCEKQQPWDMSSFEQFKDVPARGRPRESRS